MKALKIWLRNWLHDEQWAKAMMEHRDHVAALADTIRVGMQRDAARVKRDLLEMKQATQQRAARSMWRRYGAESAGKNYGRLASAASLSPYPAEPTQISTAGVRVALPGQVWAGHDAGGVIALQHIPIHPHHKLPVIDFGATVEAALLNLNQQLAQIALHEGWTLTLQESTK